MKTWPKCVNRVQRFTGSRERVASPGNQQHSSHSLATAPNPIMGTLCSFKSSYRAVFITQNLPTMVPGCATVQKEGSFYTQTPSLDNTFTNLSRIKTHLEVSILARGDPSTPVVLGGAGGLPGPPRGVGSDTYSSGRAELHTLWR